MKHPSWCTLQSIITTITLSDNNNNGDDNIDCNFDTGSASRHQVRAAQVSSRQTFLSRASLRIMSHHKALWLACRVSSLQWSVCWSCTTCWRAAPLSCGSPSTLSSSSSRRPAQTQRWLHLWCNCSRYCLCNESGCIHALYALDTVSSPRVRFVQLWVASCMRSCPGSQCTSNDVCWFCLYQAGPGCILTAGKPSSTSCDAAHVILVSVLFTFAVHQCQRTGVV